MVDKYDSGLLELNEEKICDNPSQATDPKKIDASDNDNDLSTVISPGREVECEYPGVKSREDEIEARKVEMIPNPAYETATCSKEHVSSKQSNNV